MDGLVRKMKKGDRRAAASLYDELAPKVYGFIFARTSSREAADDLSQEIFIKLIEKIGTFDEKKGNFTVWFWRLARNTLIDHYREKKEARFSEFAEEDLDRLASYEHKHGIDEKMALEKLQGFLKTLAEEEQQVFELRYVAELSYSEIAEVSGRSEGALRVSIARIKQKIREGFNKQ